MTPDEKWNAAIRLVLVWTSVFFIGGSAAVITICLKLDKIIELLKGKP